MTRLRLSAAYFGSMGGTLYASLVMHSYILSLVCCSAQVRSFSASKIQAVLVPCWRYSRNQLGPELQVVALTYFALSYFPGGTYGLKYIFYTFQTMFLKLFTSCLRG